MRATGEAPEQITRGGSGYLARESADGKSLLFQAGVAYLPLLTMPISGGATTELAHCVQPGAFVERPEGTYYVDCEPRPQPAIHLIDRRTHQDRVLGTLEKFNCDADPSLEVSRDGSAFLFSRNVRKGADLMLIENFR